MISPQIPQKPSNNYVVQLATPVTGNAASNSANTGTWVIWMVLGLLIPAGVAYGFGTVDENQVVAVLIAVLGLGAILSGPFIGLIFFLALLYIRPEEIIPQLAGMHFTLIVASVTLVSMLLQQAVNRIPFVRTPANGMVIGFGIATIVSAIPNSNISIAFQDSLRLVMLTLLMINLVRTRQRYQALITALLCFIGYLSLYTIYLYYTGHVMFQDGVYRPVGTGIFSDPNDLSSTLAPGLALLIPRLINAKFVRRVLYLCLLVLILYAIFLAKSRGAVLAVGVIPLGYLLIARVHKNVKIGIALCSLILVLGIGGRMTNFDSKEASANDRFVFWSNGCSMFLSHPISGIGYGGFSDANDGRAAHNSFVLCFGELGAFGYFFWIGTIYYGYRGSRQADESLALDEEQDLFASRMALTSYLVASFFLSHTYTPILYVLLCLPVVVLGAKDIIRPKSTVARDNTRIALISLGSFFLIYAMAHRLQ